MNQWEAIQTKDERLSYEVRGDVKIDSYETQYTIQINTLRTDSLDYTYYHQRGRTLYMRIDPTQIEMADTFGYAIMVRLITNKDAKYCMDQAMSYAKSKGYSVIRNDLYYLLLFYISQKHTLNLVKKEYNDKFVN